MLAELAPELILHIYSDCSSIGDVLNLSSTCRRLNHLLKRGRLGILFNIAEKSYGPLDDIFQIVTFNNAQPVHIRRQPVLSQALLKQTIEIGKTAKEFEEMYIQSKWDIDFMHRRMLTSSEKFRLRCAVYRIWLFSLAFHNKSYPRTTRMSPCAVDERARLLRIFSSEELIEMEDMRCVLEKILSFHICPSEGEVQRRLYGDSFVANYPFPAWNHHREIGHVRSPYSSMQSRDVMAQWISREGWGDDVSNYYVVQSFLKLDPSQISWLQKHANCKQEVQDFVSDIGESWFMDNGETLFHTIMLVLSQRGEDIEEIRQGIFDGKLGIALNSTIPSC